MDDAEEEKLVGMAARGDPEASSELVRRYRERIYRTIQRFTRNQSDTDDLFQETFLLAFKNLGGFARRSGFYTWVYRIAVNQCLNFLKKKEKEMGREAVAGLNIDGLGPNPVSPDSAVSSRELRNRLSAAIESLPPPHKAAFNLVVFQGMTHARAARVLGCSEKTVSWRMHRARKLLQARLRPYLGEAPDEM